MRWRSILFDLDGTLIDSSPGIVNSIQYARKKWGLPPGERADCLRFIGPPMPQSFIDFWGFTPEEAERFLADYREYYAAGGMFELTVYPGIPALLRSLRDAGARLFIATTKPTMFAARIAERFGFAEYFEMISGTGPGRPITKYAVIEAARDTRGIDMRDAVMIGDRSLDVEGAHAHDIPCVGALWGFGGEDELRGAGAEHIEATPETLGRLLLS